MKKMAELIEMPFGVVSRVPGNHVLDGVQIPQGIEQLFGGNWAAQCNI